ncbi:hypothetical protein PVAP13_3NG294341 [Panicum virgatum]|uniref:Uncharacterized protein n=1 Tax=Panicum virgatum TaxID=38727 RepID=A0A8T0ULK1_PANVG|nr:hypothetical protein PVAP13_3NG294341 [Panicum virgatum]
MSSDMNCPAGHAADPLCYRPGDDDDAATGRRDVDTSGFPLDMIADYSTDDLFELVREQEQGGGGGAGGAPGLRTMRPAGAESCLWSPPPRPPEVRFEPPSEAQMAAWLCTIVRGEELAGDYRGVYAFPYIKHSHTIQYMKSLQHHVQAMSIGPARPPPPPAVPVVPPQYAPPGAPPGVTVPMMPAPPVVLASAPTTMVPFGAAMLQTMPHYPAAVPVMMPASAVPLSYSYPAAPPPSPRAAAGGAGSSASHRHGSEGSSSSRKGKGGRSLCRKH